MKTRLQPVFLFLLCLTFFTPANCKDLLLQTIEYHLSAQKLFTMATVKFNNNQDPAFMILQPKVSVPPRDDTDRNPFISEQEIQQQRKELDAEIKEIAKIQFHLKLSHPIKVLIHSQDDIQQECLFDEPWDLCVIQNPGHKKELNYSIHCILEENPEGAKTGSCEGKFSIRQSELHKIEVKESNYQEKIKYESGFFQLPSTNKHSLMLISCQDDDLPSFTDSLKIFSNSRYHRYQRENEDEVKQLVGFDKTSNVEISGSDKEKVFQNKFVYLDVKEEMVRKCLQFEFYNTKSLMNDRKVFDFVNLTDTQYKNVYSVVRKSLNEQKPKQDENKVSQNKTQAKQPLFKYNLLLNLDIFKPSHFSRTTEYNIRVKIINPISHSSIVSYIFPLIISSRTLALSNSLYSKSNHFHFSYVIGTEIIKTLTDIEVEVSFQARGTPESQGKQKQNFFFLTLTIDDVQSVSVQKLGTTYLSVKKGEHITFLIEEPYEIDEIKTQTNTKSNDLIQILPSSTSSMQITLSEHSTDHEHTNECHFSQGCKFQLDIVEDCLECKIQYKTNFIKSPNDVLMLQIKETIFEGKIDLDQIQYFYKELKPSEIVQLIINTPNIIIYTLENQEDLERCKVPKKSCHTQVATSHQLIILSNQEKSRNQIVFIAVEGLDKTRFSLLLVASDKIVNVNNGIPFTYKLPSSKQQIQLLFQVPAFSQSKPYDNNITFNLISPLNSLQMDIIQMKDDDTELEAIQKSKTMSGFVKLSAKNVKSRKIKILLSKTSHYLSHPVHFTFIVSTSDHKFRLDTGITHYESLDSTQKKTFIIEFQDKHAYELNLHLYDTPEKQISFEVSVFNPNQVRDVRKNLTYKVTSKEWILVLDDDLVNKWDLCPENDPECTVFVTVSSMMSHEVEMAVTLMTQDSVMELKDGVWQTFKIDELLMKTHFYFTPSHSSNPVKIFFKSSDPQIFISAILYDNSQNINPAQWPFPDTHQHLEEPKFKDTEKYMFKSKHLIQLDNENAEFKKCFPHCVVLMSIAQSPEGAKKKYIEQGMVHEEFYQKSTATLSILASNNHIELPQKMRLTLELKAAQQQLIYVDLKHAFRENREVLTFFSNMIVGYGQIYAKVYLPSLQNIPDQDDYDILFGPVKTQVSLAQIREIFTQSIAWLADIQSVEQVLEKQELYLALFIVAEQPTKMTLEYTTDYSEISQLSIDSSETVSLAPNEQKIFQFYPTRDQKIRFIRTKGYPLFHQFKCEAQEGGFDACLKGWLQRLRIQTQDDIRNIRREREVEKQLVNSPKFKDKKMEEMAALSQQQQFSQYQILKKTQTQHVIECQRCIVFIWVYAMEDSELTIQIQSISTETLVKENEMVTDYVEPTEYHRYYLPRVQKEYTTVVVSVNEGNPVVSVTDNLNFQKTIKASQVKDTGKKVMLFTVPPAKEVAQKSHGSSKSFNTIFSNIHISVTPQDSNPVSYKLSYSSGMHEMFLKNGIISTQYLFEKENMTFYYKNQNKSSKSYLTITVEAPQDEIQKILSGIQIKMYALSMDPSKGILSKNELASEQPSTSSRKFKKHTTLTYEIPPVDDLQIDIFSQKTTKITIGLTSGQIVFLPIDYEYPIHLEPKEQIKFFVENINSELDIEFVLKKCDQSNPYIFYTIDEKQFEADRYRNYDRFGSDNMFRHVTRAEGKNALFIKVKADPKESSTLVIKANYFFENGDEDFVDLDPGNMGLIKYQIESLSDVIVNFEGLQCGKECSKVTEYFLVRGKSLNLLYKDMICSGESLMKIFEQKPQKMDKNNQKEKVQFSKQSGEGQSDAQYGVSSGLSGISISPITVQPDSENIFNLVIGHSQELPILTIKAVYKPTGEEVFYKPVEIKTIQSSVSNYSSRLLMVFAGAVLIGIIVLIVITRKVARRGYVHVGQDETMVV